MKNILFKTQPNIFYLTEMINRHLTAYQLNFCSRFKLREPIRVLFCLIIIYSFLSFIWIWSVSYQIILTCSVKVISLRHESLPSPSSNPSQNDEEKTDNLSVHLKFKFGIFPLHWSIPHCLTGLVSFLLVSYWRKINKALKDMDGSYRSKSIDKIPLTCFQF